MIKKILAILLIPSFVFASERSSEIQSFHEVTVEKGFILSIDLYYKEMCSEIWKKQIKEFKKLNPHIKDPNIILVNQKIKVQDCRVITKEVPVEKIEELKTKPNITKIEDQWFFTAFGGINFLGGRFDDTAKRGSNLGIKFGRNLDFDKKTLSISLGYLQNSERTINQGNKLGEFLVRSSFFLIDSSFMYRVSPSFNLGPVGTLLIDQDTSLREKNMSQLFGPYFGIESMVVLSKKIQLEISAEQRIDDLTNLNLFTNLGLKFIF